MDIMVITISQPRAPRCRSTAGARTAVSTLRQRGCHSDNAYLSPPSPEQADYSDSWLHADASAGIGRQHIASFDTKVVDDVQHGTKQRRVSTFSTLRYIGYRSPSISTMDLVSDVEPCFFANTYPVDTMHGTRNAAWTFSYGEDLTGPQAQLDPLSHDDTAAPPHHRLWRVGGPDQVQHRSQIAAFLPLAQLREPQAGTVSYFSHNFYRQEQLGLGTTAAAKRAFSPGAPRIRRDLSPNSTPPDF